MDFSWKQQFDELEMRIQIPNNFNRQTIEIKPSTEELIIKHNNEIILEGQLFAPVRPSETFWYIDGSELCFTFKKVKSEWWESAIKGGETVDVQKLAEDRVVNDMGRLGDEERNAIEEMMFNYFIFFYFCQGGENPCQT